MSHRNDEMYEVIGTIARRTDRAVLLNQRGHEAWLPLSQIEFDEEGAEVGREIIVDVPAWLVEDKELEVVT